MNWFHLSIHELVPFINPWIGSVVTLWIGSIYQSKQWRKMGGLGGRPSPWKTEGNPHPMNLKRMFPLVKSIIFSIPGPSLQILKFYSIGGGGDFWPGKFHYMPQNPWIGFKSMNLGIIYQTMNNGFIYQFMNWVHLPIHESYFH